MCVCVCVWVGVCVLRVAELHLYRKKLPIYSFVGVEFIFFSVEVFEVIGLENLFANDFVFVV